MARIEFTDNYEDLSTELRLSVQVLLRELRQRLHVQLRGQQEPAWPPGCCGGSAASLGGFLGNAATAPSNCATWSPGPAHDKALQNAVEEIRPAVRPVQEVRQWVCREVCWNAERGLCTDCAPIAQREISSLQAQITVEQAGEKLRAAGPDRRAQPGLQSGGHVSRLRGRERGRQVLPGVRRPLLSEAECPRCGTKYKAGAKFCPECGAKTTDGPHLPVQLRAALRGGRVVVRRRRRWS